MHPLHRLLEEVSDTKIPDIMFLLIVSFLPYGDIPQQNLISPYVFTDEREFYMRKPTPMFAESVWQYRLHVCPSLGVVLYGRDVLNERYQLDYYESMNDIESFNTLLCDAFENNLSIAGHCQCCRACTNMLIDRTDLTTDSERQYIAQHFSGDWAPKFQNLLMTCESREIQEDGVNYMILKILLGLLDDVYPIITAKQVANFLLACLQFENVHLLLTTRVTCELMFKMLYLLTTHDDEDVRGIGEEVKRVYLGVGEN